MDKFSSHYLSFYSTDFDKDISKNVVFLPVWLWEVITPVATQDDTVNFFQRTILELLKYHKNDRHMIAKWLGVDVELVDIIIDTELLHRGWVKVDARNINLTEKGWEVLNNERQQSYRSELGYLIQDALSGELWPRIISNQLNYLDINETEDGVTMPPDRNTGNIIKPFIINTSQERRYSEPDNNKIRETIERYKRAVASGRIRNEVNKDSGQSRMNTDNFELIGKAPKPYFILSHIEHSVDSNHIAQLRDPIHITQSDSWIINLHEQISQQHKPFANKIKRFMDQEDSSHKSVAEFEKDTLEEIRFEMVIAFPNLDKIPNLDEHLPKLLRRRKQLKNHENKSDIDDLMAQIQKSLEACFKHMLKKWSHKHDRVIPYNSNKEVLFQALILRTDVGFSDELLQHFATCNISHVRSAIGFSTGKYQQTNTSLKPLISANLLTIMDYSNHPLTQSKHPENDLDSLRQICELRNQTSHDSNSQNIAIDTLLAINLADFALNWIIKYISH